MESELTAGTDGLGVGMGAGAGAMAGAGATTGRGSSVFGSIRGLTAPAAASSGEVWRVMGTAVNLLGGTGVTATAAPVGLPLPLVARLRFSSLLRPWYVSHSAARVEGDTFLVSAKLRRARSRWLGVNADHSAIRLCIFSCSAGERVA